MLAGFRGWSQVLLVIVGIGDAVKMAADDRLWFVLFRPDDGVQAVLAFTNVGIATEEIDRAGAEAEQLRRDRVVVLLFGEMAIGTILGGADAAGGVGEMGIERLAAVALGGNARRCE